jgi:hypothetical protein
MLGSDRKRLEPAGSSLPSLRDGDKDTIEPLVSKLTTDRQLRVLPLGLLFPEVKAIDASVLEVGLSRAPAMAIWRARIHAFGQLAEQSPASLLAVPNLSPAGSAEILGFVVREWARVILDRSEVKTHSPAAPVAWVHTGDLSFAFEVLERNPDFDLFRRHQLDEERLSLRQLGAELGISGERVRQREKRVRAAIRVQFAARNSPLRSAVGALAGNLGALAQGDALDAAFAGLDPDGRALRGGTHRRALLIHLAGYEVCGDWVQRAGLDRQTGELLSWLTAEGPAVFDECRWRLLQLGIAEGLQRPWVEAQPGYLIVGPRLIRAAQLMEVPVAILRAAEKPLDLPDLFARTDPPMSFETFKSHVEGDDRFRSRGRNRFGLSEWQEMTYSTLAEMMAEEIERNGGSMGLADLVSAMGVRFDATESSVLYRARMPQFEVDRDGRICRQVAPLIVPPKALVLTHGCFHLGAGWATKMKVTPSLLRGTTTRIPLAFARKLGLQFGNSQEFSAPAGPLTVNWSRNAASAAQLSCMRASVAWLGAGEGDRLFLIHVGPDQLDFKLIHKAQLDQATGVAQLALECGFEPDGDPLRQVLTALGFDPNLPEAERAVRTRLRERREGRLATLLAG